MAIKSSLGKILLYGLMLASILVATVMVFAIFDKTNRTSKTYGDITEHNLFEEFDFQHYDLSNTLVFNSSGDTKSYEITYGVGADFDGTNNKYNVLVNDQPTTNNQSSYGTLVADYSITFTDVDGADLGEVTLNLEFKFYISSTNLKITTNVDVDEYSMLLEYIRVYGFDIRIIEGQYHGDYENGTEVPEAEVLPWVIDEEGNVLHYLGNSSTVTVPETYSFGEYVEDYVIYAYEVPADYSWWTSATWEQKVDEVLGFYDSYFNFYDKYSSSDYENYRTQMIENETLIYPTLDSSYYDVLVKTGVNSEGESVIYLELSITYYQAVEGNEYSTKVITNIAFSQFNNNITTANLIEVNIPASVTTLEDYAFSSCAYLITVNFAEDSQLTSIGKQAFYNCWNLSSINLPNTVASIGSWAFGYCPLLTELDVSTNLETIGENAFYGCSALEKLYVANASELETMKQRFPNYAELFAVMEV